jgi:Tripartite tricarboxylate transporter TctB family
LSNWRGIVAPPGLTAAERDAIIARIERAAHSDEWRAILKRNGWEDLLLTGPAFRQFLLAEQERVDGVLQRLGAAPDSQASTNPRRARSGLITPLTGPLIVLTLLGLLVVANFMWPETPLQSGRGGSRALILIGALSAHAVAFPIVGFVPASTALFVVTTTLFGSQRWIRDVVIGLATAVVLYLVFTFGLGLSLPADPLVRWLRG